MPFSVQIKSKIMCQEITASLKTEELVCSFISNHLRKACVKLVPTVIHFQSLVTETKKKNETIKFKRGILHT